MAYWYKDALAVLRGLRGVANAYYSEASSELQHVAANSSLRPLAGALYERVSTITDKVQELQGPGGASACDEELDWDSFGENSFKFTGLTEHMPPPSHIHRSDPPPMPTQEGVLADSVSASNTPQSTDTGSKPTDVAASSSHRRTYHTFACPARTFHTPIPVRNLHTTACFWGNATVIGSTAHSSDNSSEKDSDSTTGTNHNQKLTARARERAVPASRLSRMVTFGGLAASLGIGTATEAAKRALGGSDSSLGKSLLLTEANIERIVSTLCTVRGAALKLGQMISLQDGALVPDSVQQVFERVRNNADFMPAWQMERVLEEELGIEWRKKLKEFDPRPLAAASIGQVHRATMHDGREVAMKIQYPGVAQSINSDIDNLVVILKLWNIVPEGLFLNDTIAVARKELAWETDYIREAQCGMKFKELLSDDPRFRVPSVIPELSTKRVLTADLIHGIPLDKCVNLNQETKNDIAERILNLCLRELFEFRLMQTDPNWSNFFYNEEDGKLYLLDFGATRDYPKAFTDDYIKIIRGGANKDRAAILKGSKKLGFLTGYESKMLVEAHIDAVMILGEPFGEDRPFDFSRQDTTRRIHNLIPVMMEHRLTPPPAESYSLHRKMAGAFLLCTKLGATINCYPMFQQMYQNYKF